MVARYVRATLNGEFTAGQWLGETASLGLSLVPVTAFDHINSPLLDFDADADGTAGAWSGGTFLLGWIGMMNSSAQQGCAEALLAYANSIDVWQSDDFQWNEIRIAAIQANGDYVNGASIFTISSPVVGTASTMSMPPQNAIVTSLRTGGRGPRNRGRWYTPVHTSAVLDSAGLLSSTTMTNGNTFANTLLDAQAALGPVTPVVVSPTHGTFSTITATAVGDEMDTQRRRWKDRPEQYTVAAWP